MPNILFLSNNDDFTNDIAGQIAFYAKDFVVFRQEDADVLFDIIILDEKPEQQKELRKSHPQTPIFIIQTETCDLNEESNLSLCVSKPLSLDGFLNKLRSSINLLESSADGYLYFNQYELHPVNKEILNTRNNEIIKLTEREVSIIKYLYKARDKIVSKNELLQEVWGYSPDVTTHTIETHIYRLRQKVEHDNLDAQLILTDEGGYRLKM